MRGGDAVCCQNYFDHLLSITTMNTRDEFRNVSVTEAMMHGKET